MKRKHERGGGFTLVELMVVIAILGILAAIVAVSVSGRTYDAQKAKVAADFQQIAGQLEIYKIHMYDYPEKLEYLLAAPPEDDGGRWSGPYLKSVPIDPWGNPYYYSRESVTGAGFDLVSFGRDGRESGSAKEDKDLTIHELLYKQKPDGM